jgi:molybdenum cofactor cytidylyltransferase
MASLTAIILAAGRSTRMGSPKPLMPLGETTFLGWLITAYRQLELPLRVVLGPDWRNVTDRQPVSVETLLINPRPELGPLSSLLIALADLPEGATGILVHPVDHPLVRLETLRSLAQLHGKRPDRILVPTFQGKKGHPTLFPSGVFDELQKAPLDQGARSVVYAEPERLLMFETDDPGILRNIDTPDDYARWVGTDQI